MPSEKQPAPTARERGAGCGTRWTRKRPLPMPGSKRPLGDRLDDSVVLLLRFCAQQARSTRLDLPDGTYRHMPATWVGGVLPFNAFIARAIIEMSNHLRAM